MNARRILEVLRAKGPCSRAEITRHSGISAPTVSKVIKMLLDSGLVEEGDAPPNTVGRPGRHLRLAGDAVRVVGVELNVGHWRMTVSGFDGGVADLTDLEVQEYPVPHDYSGLLDDLCAKIAPMTDDPTFELLGVGLSTPGLIDSREERVVLSPNLGITDGQQIGKDLARRLGGELKCVMLQEVNAHCLAERLFGGAAGEEDFALLDMTTGLGVGAVVRGEIFTGSSGYAGELGHVRIDSSDAAKRCGCGNYGCLETVATEAALCARIAAATGAPVTVEEALTRIKAGDKVANAALDTTLEHFAVAISFVINLLNPHSLFVYSQILDAREGLFERLATRTRELALGPPGKQCALKRAEATKIQGALAAILSFLMQEQGPRVR